MRLGVWCVCPTYLPTYLPTTCFRCYACSVCLLAEKYMAPLWKKSGVMNANPYPTLFFSFLQEVHIMHTFQHDFYGARMNLLICGFIRPEYDYVSKESLIEDINVDIDVAKRSLDREAYLMLKGDRYLLEFGGEGHEDEVAS